MRAIPTRPEIEAWTTVILPTPQPHAEDIRWTAERLAEAHNLAGQQLKAKAAELEGIRFDGEGDTSGDPTIGRWITTSSRTAGRT